MSLEEDVSRNLKKHGHYLGSTDNTVGGTLKLSCLSVSDWSVSINLSISPSLLDLGRALCSGFDSDGRFVFYSGTAKTEDLPLSNRNSLSNSNRSINLFRG